MWRHRFLTFPCQHPCCEQMSYFHFEMVFFAPMHVPDAVLGRSLMIGWRKNSWNPERVPTEVTCVCVCLRVCLSVTRLQSTSFYLFYLVVVFYVFFCVCVFFCNMRSFWIWNLILITFNSLAVSRHINEHIDHWGYPRQIHKKTSPMPSCSGPIPAQKSRGNSVLGVVFSPHDAQNGFSLFP